MLFPKQFSTLLIFIVAIISLQDCTVSEDSTHTLLREARDLEYSGSFKKAEETFKSIPILNNKEASPLRLAILMDMGTFYLRIKEYAKAIIICDKALKVCDDVYDPNDALKISILFMQASAYEELSDYDKAKSIYNSLLLSAEHDPQAKEMRILLPLVRLGDMEFKKNNYQQALKLYYKASTMTLLPDPFYRILNYRMGVCSVALGRTAGSEGYFKSSLPVDYWEAGLTELFDAYGQLLKRNYKYNSATRLLSQKAVWQYRRQKYLDWLSARVAAPLRFNLLDKCTEKDFLDFTDAAKTSKSFNRFIQTPNKMNINYPLK